MFGRWPGIIPSRRSLRASASPAPWRSSGRRSTWRAVVHEQLNARLWKIYNSVPGEAGAASDAELRRVSQLVTKTIEWFGQRTAD